ncbi:hypothetical protein AK812_SmicGene32230 [Symbiodinium microadriaticum]|uniref:Uncharacterized protein n=1 Tax=Symbiodinium microadriaticum TaxID=2951 RepID=A0A1Q9CUN5_SYMMI|nr:hypothetical protein AK812_SmicGene32230 [Symbiodinium microadriaticum]
MLTAKPSDDEASLPRRFRTVLFLDVFGDAAFDPTEAEHAAVTAGVDGKMEELRDDATKREVTAGVDGKMEELRDDATKREVQQRQAAKAGFALQAAQGALRCWEAVPQELLTGVQASQLQNLRQEYTMWRERYHGCYSKMKSRRGVPYDSAQQDARALRRWDELTPAEQEADEFYQALVGPLQRRADASQSQYYDVSRGCSVWTAPPGVTILDLHMASHRVQEAEYDVQMLLDIERGDLKIQEEKEDGLQTPAGVFRKKRAGHHRLPWKSVRRMTAVIQVCWIFLGTQNLLNNFGWWVTSWRWHWTSNRGDRRLSASGQEWPESFEVLSVSWPHGSFFDPCFLSCVETSHGSQPHVFVGNSYRQFAVTPKNESSASISLSPLSLQSLPAGATVLHCAREGCTVAKLEEDGTGIAVWHTKPLETPRLPSEPHHVFRIEGQPWQRLSGARVRCSSVGRLLPDAKGDCYLFAGWDGQRVPLVAIEASTTAVPADLRPRVDAPLAENTASQCTRDVTGLHVSVPAESGDVRLWALLGKDIVQAWDLSLLEPIGHWKLPSLGDPSFEAINPTAFVGRYEKLAGRSAVSERSGERSSLDLTEDIIAFFCKDEKNVEIADVFNPANYTFRSPENIMKSILELLAINWEQLGNMPFADAITSETRKFTALAHLTEPQAVGQQLQWDSRREVTVLPQPGTYAVVKCAGEHFFRALFTQPATLGLAGGHAGLAAEQPVLFAGEIQLGPNSELQAWTNVTGTYHFPEDLAQQSGLPADAFWAFQPSCNPANSTEAIALPGGHALVRSTHAASGVYANAVLHSPVRLPLKANSWCTHCTPVLYCVTNSDSAISCEHLLRAFNEVPLSKIGLLSYASACKVSARRDADPNSPDAVAPAASVASCSHIRQLHVDWAKGLEVARRSMCPNSVRQGDFRHMFREVEDKIPQKLCARGQARRREGRALCEVRQEDGPRLFLAGVGREPLLLSARLEGRERRGGERAEGVRALHSGGSLLCETFDVEMGRKKKPTNEEIEPEPFFVEEPPKDLKKKEREKCERETSSEPELEPKRHDLDPDIQQLAYTFKIDAGLTQKLNDIMIEKRMNTWEQDLARLYEILKDAHTPAAMLNLKVKDMQKGTFVGKV